MTKQQLLRGIADYLETELIPGLSEDRGVQILANTALCLIRSNVSLVDKILNKSVVKLFLCEDEKGEIDIEPLIVNLKSSIEKYKYLPINIPIIPFLTTEEKQLKLDLEDIQKLEKYIKREC